MSQHSRQHPEQAPVHAAFTGVRHQRIVMDDDDTHAALKADIRPNPAKCPRAVVIPLTLYVSNRIPTGGFLRNVLCNDLVQAIHSADCDNLAALPHIVAWLYHRAPVLCWGSPEKVKAWLSRSERG